MDKKICVDAEGNVIESLDKLCEKYDITKEELKKRLESGMTYEEALTGIKPKKSKDYNIITKENE